MQKITPFLWFDDKAEEAVNFYVSIFKNSKIESIARYGEEGAKASGRKKGTVMTVAFQLNGQHFTVLNGGPIFKFTPAISFFVSCETAEEVDKLFGKLSKNGEVLMELQEYPFSKRYAWIKDSYGVSWQLFLGSRKQKITPCLMFAGDNYGKAVEAMNFYVSVFDKSKIEIVVPYEKGEGEKEGAVKHAAFSFAGEQFIAMDSGRNHPFTFSLATSFVINCDTQKEVDEFWEKLSKGGEKGQCGWLKDKYGMSWQVVPTVLGEMLQDKNAEKTERVMKAILKMHKIDIKTLKRAYNEKN